MKLRTPIIVVSTLLLMLGTASLLAACQSLQKTNTAATEAQIAADVCRAWRPVTYSSRDTEQTRTEARANNAARDAYCIAAVMQ